MASITHRVGQIRNLTANEVDSNFDALNTTKQDVLVSNVNVKTVNGTTVLGPGDIVLQTPLVSGVNVKTINGASLLGSTDIPLAKVSQVVTSGSTAITVVAATHDANTLSCTSSSAVTLTLNTGVGLVTGLAIEQRGGGIVTLAGTATFIAPNGQATSGQNTTMLIVPTESADTYLIVVNRTSDATLVNATAGATPAVNMGQYNIVDLTLTANCTPVFSGAVSGQAFSVTLILRQDGTGSRTLTLPTTKWNAGTPFAISTAANAIDIISLMTVNGGTSYFGFIAGKAFA